jgi:hypothetical protein
MEQIELIGELHRIGASKVTVHPDGRIEAEFVKVQEVPYVPFTPYIPYPQSPNYKIYW